MLISINFARRPLRPGQNGTRDSAGGSEADAFHHGENNRNFRDFSEAAGRIAVDIPKWDMT